MNDKFDPDKYEPERHHPWCNYFALPADGCRFCKPLFEKYPLKEGQSVEDMAKEYFPEAIIIK